MGQKNINKNDEFELDKKSKNILYAGIALCFVFVTSATAISFKGDKNQPISVEENHGVAKLIMNKYIADTYSAYKIENLDNPNNSKPMSFTPISEQQLNAFSQECSNNLKLVKKDFNNYDNNSVNTHSFIFDRSANQKAQPFMNCIDQKLEKTSVEKNQILELKYSAEFNHLQNEHDPNLVTVFAKVKNDQTISAKEGLEIIEIINDHRKKLKKTHHGQILNKRTNVEANK